MIKQLKVYSKINFSKELEYRTAAISGTLKCFLGLCKLWCFLAFYESSQSVLDFTIVRVTYGKFFIQCSFFNSANRKSNC